MHGSIYICHPVIIFIRANILFFRLFRRRGPFFIPVIITSKFIGLNLNVPIFNRFQTRNNVRNARINQENQQLALDNTKKTLYKEIQQVYYNALNAQTKERSSAEAVASSRDAFELMQAKYENGKASVTEFNESKNNFLKSESDLVQARYENLYQHALLEFYRGRELAF